MLLFTKKHKSWFDFLFAMTQKEIKVRYKNAVLGFLWILINPIIQMLVIGFIFQYFIKLSVENYYLYLFAGLLAWEFFSYSVSKVTQSIVFERTLIKKAYFPREAIVLSIILSNAFHMIVSYVLFIVALGMYRMIWFSISPVDSIVNSLVIILQCMPYIFLLLIFCSGLGLITSSLNVKYRDVNFVVKALLPVWFYATPVIYQLGMLPEKTSELISKLNPMAFIINGIRSAVLQNHGGDNSLAIVPMIIILATALLGIIVFKNQSKLFDDWI